MRPRTRLKLRTLLRRTFLYLLLPPLCLLTLRLAWGGLASYRLSLLQKKFAAVAIPVELPRELSPDQNAITDLAHATDIVQSLPQPDRALINGDNLTTSFGDITWTDAESEALDRVLSQNRHVLELIDSAGARPIALWPNTFPIGSQTGATLGGVRQLANFTYVAALREHANGHHALAMENLNRTLIIARLIDEHHSIIGHLVAMFIYSIAANGVERLEPNLHWDDPEVQAQARKLIAVLSDTERFQRTLTLCWQQDYLVAQSSFTQFSRALNSWWLRPLLDDQMRRDMRLTLDNLPAFHAPNWPTAKTLFPPPRAALPNLHLNEFLFADSGIIDRVALLSMGRRCDAFGIACLLAARLYAAQHGQLPTTAEQLATVLGKIPADPFDKNNAPLHYRLDPTGPTVWGVGEDGIDGGGILPPGTSRRWFGSSLDAVYGAAWRVAKTPTSLPASLPATAPEPPKSP